MVRVTVTLWFTNHHNHCPRRAAENWPRPSLRYLPKIQKEQSFYAICILCFALNVFIFVLCWLIWFQLSNVRRLLLILCIMTSSYVYYCVFTAGEAADSNYHVSRQAMADYWWWQRRTTISTYYNINIMVIVRVRVRYKDKVRVSVMGRVMASVKVRVRFSSHLSSWDAVINTVVCSLSPASPAVFSRVE